MIKFILTSLSIFGLIFLFSCEHTTKSGNDELQVDETVVEQAALGFQFNQVAGTGTEINSYTNPSDVNTGDLSGFNTAMALKEKANTVLKESRPYLAKLRQLNKTYADSVLFQFNDTTGNIVTKLAIYYDAISGIARYQVVSIALNGARRIQYDSTSIRVDLNNLANQDDDRFQDLYNWQRLKDGFILKTIETKLTATDWALDGEITAFNAVTTSTYNESRQLEKVVASITLNTDQSGTLSQTFYFRDGTSTSHSVTFNNDGTGTFSRDFRNGANISGSFDVVEDDGEGFYESLTTFPDGFYIATILKSATLAFNFVNQQVSGHYSEVLTFNDGTIDSANVDINVTNDNGLKTTVLQVTKRNGAYGTFTINEGEDISAMDGTWTTWDKFFIVITAEYFSDGSAWIKYEIYLNENAYNRGVPALASAEYNFSPDGSGEGTYTKDSDVYQLQFESSGKGEIVKGNASKTIELFR